MRFKLKEMRKQAGFQTAKDFAEHLGMPVGTYVNYEQGKRRLTLERAWEFADELGCTLDELAGRQWPPPGSEDADPRLGELARCWSALGEPRRIVLLANAHDAVAAQGRDAERGSLAEGLA